MADVWNIASNETIQLVRLMCACYEYIYIIIYIIILYVL